jgi:hypothetical protein
MNLQTQWYEDKSNTYEPMQLHSWGGWGLKQAVISEEEVEEKEEEVVVVWYNCGAILLFQWRFF